MLPDIFIHLRAPELQHKQIYAKFGMRFYPSDIIDGEKLLWNSNYSD